MPVIRIVPVICNVAVFGNVPVIISVPLIGNVLVICNVPCREKKSLEMFL